MARIDLKYAYPVKDRYGKSPLVFSVFGQEHPPAWGARIDFVYGGLSRRNGQNRTGSPRHHMPAGSVAAAIALYLNSADFSGLAPATRADRLRILTSLARTDRGGLPFARMESQDVERLLAEKAAAPHAAKSLLKVLRSRRQGRHQNGRDRQRPDGGRQGSRTDIGYRFSHVGR